MGYRKCRCGNEISGAYGRSCRTCQFNREVREKAISPKALDTHYWQEVVRQYGYDFAAKTYMETRHNPDLSSHALDEDTIAKIRKWKPKYETIEWNF